MSLEGLRAWIGEVERKLGKRTRVFLALAVIAIGLGGAAIYLAIDARESSVSEGDVQALQEELEAQIDEAATGAGAVTPPTEPGAEGAPDAEPAPGERGAGGSSGNGAKDGGDGTSSDGASGSVPDAATNSAKVQELLEQEKERNADAEVDSDGE